MQFGIPNSRLRYYLLARRKREDHGPSASSAIMESQCLTEHPGTKEERASCKRVKDYLEEEGTSDFLVPEKILSKQAGVLDIVTPERFQCCCFTRGYTNYAEGTGSVL